MVCTDRSVHMTTQTHPQPSRVRNGRATREAIVLAAKRLMCVRGYKGTSLDDVLRESGVGKGNFYYYFKSKEDLGYAILDEVIVAFLERTLAPCFADRESSRLAQIRCFLGRLIEAQRERNGVGGCPLGTLASELSDVHEGFRARLADVFATWSKRLTLALSEARERGEVNDECRPEAIARFIVASLEGAFLLTKVKKDIAVMEQCVEELGRYLELYERRS